MITYPVAPESRWAVLQLSTGELVSRNKPWPVADGSAIPGLDADYVYLLQLTDAQPDYDPRLFTLEKLETIDAPANEIRVSWQTLARPVDDVKINAANVEAVENQRHLTSSMTFADPKSNVMDRLLHAFDKQYKFPDAVAPSKS